RSPAPASRREALVHAVAGARASRAAVLVSSAVPGGGRGSPEGVSPVARQAHPPAHSRPRAERGVRDGARPYARHAALPHAGTAGTDDAPAAGSDAVLSCSRPTPPRRLRECDPT